MASPKKDTPLKSPLLSAFNNIVSINRSRSTMRSTQTSYNEFLRFMSVEVKNIEAIKLPDDKKIKKLANINVTSTFGSAGSLLSSLASGALDVGGLVGDFFGGRKKNPKAGKPIPKGTKIKIPGVRGLPIISTALAGLDFSQGISEGESVGKAGAGALGSAAGAAGGALAGTALAGVIGQALVPIPGLGFVLGAGVGALGGMAGGWLADRAYESATGEGKVKEKTKARLKEQEQKQKIEAASLTQLTFPQVLDKFDSVVTQFERSVSNLDLTETTTPIGYDEELSPEEAPKLPDGTTDEGAGTVQYGTGNAEFGETGNVSNQGGWVHGHFQSDNAAAVTKDTAMVVKALLKQGSPVFLNPGVDLSPSKQYSDAEITQYVENARRAHTHSGTGKSIDVFVKKGTKVPVPLTDVGPTGKDFGGYGRGGIAGYIQGTRTWIGHLKPGSKGGLSQQKGEIKAKGKESGEMEGLQPQPKTQDNPQAAVRSQTKPISTAATKPSQDLSQMSTDQLKGMLDPTMSAAANPAIFQAAQESRIKGQESGLSGDDLERAVMIASIRAKNAESQVVAMSQQPVVPQQLEQYPEYDSRGSSIMLIPMMMGGSNSGSQQRPMVISSGGGGETTIMPPVPQGQVLNSLFNTMLLTNLSGT